MSKIKAISVIGHLSFLLLLVLSIVFALERNLYADSSFYIFNIVNNGWFDIEHSRYSAFLTQLLPIALVKLGMSLQAVIYAYSISFILLYYGIWLIINYVLKDPYSGIALLLILILPVRENFFKPVTELHQALAWSILLYSWINNRILKNSKNIKIDYKFLIITILLILLCFFSHPVSLFPILFIFTWIVIDKKIWTDWKIYFFLALTLILFSIKFLMADNAGYEGERYSNISNLINLLPKLHTYYSWKWFMHHFFRLFLIPSLLLIAYIGFAFTKKMYLKATISVLSVIGFFIISVITFKQGDADIMMEKNFMPLSLFILIPFTTEVLKTKRIKGYFVVSLVSILVLFSTYRTTIIGKRYSKRINYVTQIINFAKDNDIKKAIIHNKNIDKDILLISWGLSLETLVLSSLYGSENSVSIYIYNKLTDVQKSINNPKRFLFVNWYLNRDISILNENYFLLPEKKYTIIEKEIIFQSNN